MPISNDIAALIGFACESILYGLYIPLFLLCMLYLTTRRRTQAYNVPMIVATILLFLLCTCHYSLEFNHFYTYLESTGIVKDYANENNYLYAADVILSLTDFIGDLVLLYRCWLVWGGNYFVCILPFLTALGGFLCAMSGLGILRNTNPNAPVAPAALVPLGTASFALPLVTNFIITFLIVGRIYYIGYGTSFFRRRRQNDPAIEGDQAEEVAQSTARHIQDAASIMIESGALYLLVQFVFVVAFGIGNVSQAILGVIGAQIYGIAPTLISFRVGLGVSAEYTTAAMTTTGISWARPATTRTGLERTNHTYATRPTMTTDYGTTDVEYEDVELARREKHDSVSKASGSRRSMDAESVGSRR